MAVRTLIPLLTGGTMVAVALAAAYALRPTRPLSSDDVPMKRDPVVPDDEIIEVLERASLHSPTPRNEAEAIAGVGAAWPNTVTELSSEAERDLIDPIPESAPTRPNIGLDTPLTYARSDDGRAGTLGGFEPGGFREVDPEQAFLDLQIEFEDLETPTAREELDAASPDERWHSYVAPAPERERTLASGLEPTELSRSHLERMDTLEDLGDVFAAEVDPRKSETRATDRESQRDLDTPRVSRRS